MCRTQQCLCITQTYTLYVYIYMFTRDKNCVFFYHQCTFYMYLEDKLMPLYELILKKERIFRNDLKMSKLP
ncbi:hypothetical protein KP509_33G062400 [Ceratopteris richardii]|nr:hypothetical protein KP509_33G062400 [Ceratopteris richardii]